MPSPSSSSTLVYCTMLTSAERQPLRNAGRHAYFKAHGKHDWLLQAAKEAKGANARTKELTAWKRNVCNRACFVKSCLRPTPLLHGSGAFPKFPIIKTSLGSAFHTPHMWPALATLQRFAIEKLKHGIL